MSDTQQAATDIAIALCERRCDKGARASWGPAMADEFAKALTQSHNEGLERAANIAIAQAGALTCENVEGCGNDDDVADAAAGRLTSYDVSPHKPFFWRDILNRFASAKLLST